MAAGPPPARERGAGLEGARLGAEPLAGGWCRFLVWAPRAQTVSVRLVSPRTALIPLRRLERGYFGAVARDVEPGARYLYVLNGGKKLPDPASRLQPGGVHGPSQLVEESFAWRDGAWRGRALKDSVIYEMHVGTFTPEGTFQAAIPRLKALRELGVTAVELMPVAQFPGRRGWGYDGVFPFAVQESYGGPAGLKRLVDACHKTGLSVVLDVVYNHVGPEGGVLAEFGPYLDKGGRTAWGPALNFDGAGSDEVRRFFLENVQMWIRDFHVDALRLDAVAHIRDGSERTFLEELSDAVREESRRTGRRIWTIGENGFNNARHLLPPGRGGLGFSAQWLFDFHHSLHALMTGERGGRYQDFGSLKDLAAAFSRGYVLDGRYSGYRGRRVGGDPRLVRADQLVVYAQSHDEVGNRLRSDRLGKIVGFEGAKLAAGAALLSPFVPMMFMGEEYGESAPFPFFTDYSEPKLAEAARRGRRAELSDIKARRSPPDPQRRETFASARLHWELRGRGAHKALLGYYRELLRLRREVPALSFLSKKNIEVLAFDKTQTLLVRRRRAGSQALLVMQFGRREAAARLPIPAGRWVKRLDSADPRWGGPGSRLPRFLSSTGKAWLELKPLTFALFEI